MPGNIYTLIFIIKNLIRVIINTGETLKNNQKYLKDN